MFQVEKDKLKKMRCLQQSPLPIPKVAFNSLNWKPPQATSVSGEAIAWWDRSQNVQEVHEGSVHDYHPHRYPIAARVHLNPFIRPYLTHNRNFENQVGMRCFNFCELLDKLKSAGLDVVSMVALYGTKLGQDISFLLLSTMYGSDDPMGKVSLMLKRNLNI